MESASSNRFVKVRFDNKAGTQVKVIPNKGQNKNEGYTVEPHMTLDLNFEEKGQQNDIPIRFRVSNPSAPGGTLLMNEKKGPVVVVPSANKDEIKLVTITAACEYLLFAVVAPPMKGRWQSDFVREAIWLKSFTIQKP